MDINNFRFSVIPGDSSYLAYAAQQHTDAKLFYRHCHSDYEIYCFMEGHGNFILENTKIALEPGDVVFIRPANYHYVETLGDCIYNRTVINISPGTVAVRRLGPFMKRLEEKGPFFNISGDPHLLRLLKQPVTYYDALTEDERAEYVMSIVSQFIIELGLSGAPRTEQSTALSDVTRRIIDFVNTNIEAPLSVETIAKGMYLSKSYVANKFLSEMHIGIMQFVRSKKILHAKILLEEGVLPQEVSLRCGYADYTTFYRTFKKITGISPSRIKAI